MSPVPLRGKQTVPQCIVQQKTGTDTISFRERWRQLKLAHCAIPNYGSTQQFWNNKSKVDCVYLKRRPRDNSHADMARLETMNIPDGSAVLDIGAGPGTFAIPLARRGCKVTVVEPSPVMRDALSARLTKDRIRSVKVIPGRWEDVSAEELGGPYDAVIASYSLTMLDIGDAVLRMQSCCRGTVHLFWFLTPPAWVRVNTDLWPILHGGAFPGEPLADWLWQVLFEMGILANLRVEHRSPPASYNDTEEAIAEFRQRLNCTTEAHEQILRNYFRATLRKDGARYVLGDPVMGAHIWWDTQQNTRACGADTGRV